MNLSEIKKTYFLGIGGIGMSALARYFKSRGCEVHGYDKTETDLTKKLVNEGMEIHYTEDLSKIPPGLDLVVWTPAVPKNHQELLFFQNSHIPLKKRAEVLGIISRGHRTVAVAGTHGKTTTSSLLTHVLRTGGVDCTAFLGGIAQNWQSNYVEGSSDWVVAEADEYDRSFLHLSPDIAVLLSMDPDHLDIYGDAGQVQETGFKAFLKKVKPGGQVLVNENLAPFFDNQDFETFGISKGTYRAEQVGVVDGTFVFDFVAPVPDHSWEADSATNGGGWGRSYEAGTGEKAKGKLSQSEIPNQRLGRQKTKEVRWKGIRFAMPGRHNVENATAAIAVALKLGLLEKDIRKALATFKGIKRRFEIVYRDEKTVFVDDYAHHPTEIRSAVQAAKELFAGRKVTGIFQPHLYSRTRDFQDGFAEELDKLDSIILMDIYPAREEPIPGITSEVIFEKMKNPDKVLVTKANVLEVLKSKDLDVVMTIGAGDIDTFVEPIEQWLKGR